MAHVYYTKTLNGRIYPKARQNGENVSYLNEVKRENGRVKSKYLGIFKVPEGVTPVSTKPTEHDLEKKEIPSLEMPEAPDS